MNILYLVSKKRFDMILGRYLQNYGRVIFVTNSPGETLSFMENGLTTIDALRAISSYTPVDKKVLSSCPWEKTLAEVECYRLAKSDQEKRRIRDFFLRYLNMLLAVIKKNNIDVCLCHERDFLDTGCAEVASQLSDIRTYYFSTGFFRGKTLSVAPERIRFTDCDIWEKRIQQNLQKPPLAKELPKADYLDEKLKKPSVLSQWLSRLQVVTSPEKRCLLSYLRPKRPLLEAIYHKHKKRKIRSYKQLAVDIKEPFVLVPLQGNEVFNLVKNPFGIKDMEHLSEVVINAVTRLNKRMKTNFQVVLKEHPFRPFVIKENFTRDFPGTILLRKYDMNELLKKASLIVTFNSLAGFEALQIDKPVVTLGPIFYGLKGMVYQPDKIEALHDAMWQAMTHDTDKEKLGRLISYLKIKYEVEADRRKPTGKGLYNIALKVLANDTLDPKSGLKN